jgi:large subunit ribosomal protein L9
MAKRVQLVLTQNVYKLGTVGDLVEVAPGYARNFLLPQKLAQATNPGILRQVERRRELERQRLAELKAAALEQKTTLEALKGLSVAKQVGENDAIFGSVTNAEVAELLKSTAQVEIDRRDITVPEVKKLGTYRVDVKLHPEVTVTLELAVTAE